MNALIGGFAGGSSHSPVTAVCTQSRGDLLLVWSLRAFLLRASAFLHPGSRWEFFSLLPGLLRQMVGRNSTAISRLSLIVILGGCRLILFVGVKWACLTIGNYCSLEDNCGIISERFPRAICSLKYRLKGNECWIYWITQWFLRNSKLTATPLLENLANERECGSFLAF